MSVFHARRKPQSSLTTCGTKPARQIYWIFQTIMLRVSVPCGLFFQPFCECHFHCRIGLEIKHASTDATWRVYAPIMARLPRDMPYQRRSSSQHWNWQPLARVLRTAPKYRKLQCQNQHSRDVFIHPPARLLSYHCHKCKVKGSLYFAYSVASTS